MYSYISPQLMKAGILEPEETASFRQRLAKHLAVTNIYATREELLEAVFSMRFVLYQTLNL
jgi:hypothetical protein